MKKSFITMLSMSMLVVAAGLFTVGPSQAATVTQLDITGGSIGLNFGSFSASQNFTRNGQLVMGQYQPLPNIFAPVTIAGHTFSLFTSNQVFPGNPAGAPAPTGSTSGSAINVDLRSLFAGVTGPLITNAALNIGEPATGTFNTTTNAFTISWTQPFTGVPFLTSGTFSLRGTAQLAAVPLPAAALLFVSGLGAVAWLRRKMA